MFASFNEIRPASAAILICLTTAGYCLSLVIYRLYFHKLSRFPGPGLAALSTWYEFYFDVYHGGKFVFQIEKLHEQYGPIIRITPDELHISDPDFYAEFFTKQGPQSKYEPMANRFNAPENTFGMIHPDRHKLRRGALENMFSRHQIRQLLPVLQEKTAKMLSKLGKYVESGKVVRLDRAFMALSEEMIFEYGFGISNGALDKPDFQDPLHEVFVAAGGAGALVAQFPIIGKLMDSMPDWLVLIMQPGFYPLIKLRKDFNRELDALENISLDMPRNTKAHRTVMYDVLTNPNLPPAEKSRLRMLHDSQLVIGAGLSTTGWAATVAAYYILANSTILKRLREELFSVVPAGEKSLDCTDLDWAALESLPYFQACLKEALRLSFGMSARNARRTHNSFVYSERAYSNANANANGAAFGHGTKPVPTKTDKQHLIPAMTPVSMSIPIHNLDKRVFIDARAFNPDRWLPGPDGSRLPDKYFVTFGKGSRMCLGMQLAWAELSLMIAGTVRWFDLELFETGEASVLMDKDNVIPVPKEGTEGVRVKVKAELV